MSVKHIVQGLKGCIGSGEGHKVLQRRALKEFADRMLAKLELRNSKNGQGPLLGRKKDHDVWNYFKRIRNETIELQQALKRHDRVPSPNTREAVIDECCDIANFCAAVAEKVLEDVR